MRGSSSSILPSESEANLPSRFLFSWLTPFVLLGSRRPLESSDLGDVLPVDESARLGAALFAHLPSSAPTPRELMWALLRLTASDMAHAGAGKLVGDLLGFIGPLSVSGIITFVAARNAGLSDARWNGCELGYLWLVAGVVAGVLQNLGLHRHHHHSIRSGMHARSALSALIFQKSLRLSAATRARLGAGKLQTLLSADAQNLNLIFWYLHYAWAGPLQLALTLAMLVSQIGVGGALVALGTLIVLSPLQAKIGARIGALTKIALSASEARIKSLSEALGGIRVVKALGWEPAWIARVDAAREKELAQKRGVAVVGALNSALVEVAPLAVAAAAFGASVGITGQPLSPTAAFVSLTLYNILRLPVMVLPMLFGAGASARVSAERISEFLCEADAVSPVGVFMSDDESARGTDARLDGVRATWAEAGKKAETSAAGGKEGVSGKSPTTTSGAEEKPALKFVLDNVSARFAPSTLTCIIGGVGSGKTSLLHALLGELDVASGVISLTQPRSESVASSIAFAPQVPFILNSTVRDNVTFFSALDEARLAAALTAAQLDADIAGFSAGLDTEIGERGVTLSGGQRARVGLARALYSRAPLLLLDDPLAAVDAKVARALFASIRGPLGRGGGRTVVLVTHALQFIPDADAILVLADGRVVASGTFEDLKAAPEGTDAHVHFGAALAARARIDADLACATTTAQTGIAAAQTTTAAVVAAVTAIGNGADNETARTQPATAKTTDALSNEAVALTLTVAAPTKARAVGTVIVTEDRARGAVPASLYASYVGSFGHGPLLGVALAAAFLAAARVASDIFLASWSNDSYKASSGLYIGVYFALSCATASAALGHALAWALGGISGARDAHSSMLLRVLRSPITFFDSTPTGRIVNRFSSDIAILDKDLPSSFAGVAGLMSRVLTTVAVQAYVLPWTLLAAAPLLTAIGIVFPIYRASSRELRRLDLASKSLATAALSEAFVGAAAIRNAAGAESAANAGFSSAIDANTRAYWRSNLVNRWLGLRLDTLGVVASYGLVSLAIVLSAGTTGAPSPGLVGLALAYSSGIAGLLNWLIRSATETETQLTSAERVAAWAALPVERAAQSVPGTLPPNWPSAGDIRVTGLTARYRDDLPPCLDDVNLHLPAGARVAIVGRTGAGKSSLALALLRIVEAEAGGISIDGIDIGSIGLDDLRSRIAVVVQDSTLFSGTLRDALDPLGQYADAALVAAVERVGANIPGGLGARVDEGGGNVSVGQRQLICVARALLKRAKVYLLDESSAALDDAADAALTSLLKTELAGATVISIAHRVAGTLDADLVVVLEKGRVLECASPSQLLADENSSYSALVRAAQTNKAGSSAAD